MPVNNGNQVHPSVGQSDVGKIDSPDVVEILGCDVPEEIRIDLVLQRPFAEVWTGLGRQLSNLLVQRHNFLFMGGFQGFGPGIRNRSGSPSRACFFHFRSWE